jgi:uncharacterized protein (TIGR00369 family)
VRGLNAFSGRALLEGIRDGRFPPPATAALLDLDLDVVEEGRTVFGFQPGARFDNGQGAVHGGILATVADFAVSTATMSAAPPDTLVTTTNLALTYVRAVPVTAGRLTAEGRLLHRGRTLAHAEAVLTDGEGRRLAHATATLAVIRPD